jgi:hypothetical protein
VKVKPLEQRWLEEMHGDEDLGKLDLSGLMSGMGGLGAAAGLGDGSEMAEVMKMLDQLGLGGAVLSGAPGSGAGAAPGGLDPQVEQMLKGLMGQ